MGSDPTNLIICKVCSKETVSFVQKAHSLAPSLPVLQNHLYVGVEQKTEQATALSQSFGNYYGLGQSLFFFDVRCVAFVQLLNGFDRGRSVSKRPKGSHNRHIWIESQAFPKSMKARCPLQLTFIFYFTTCCNTNKLTVHVFPRLKPL